MTAYAAKMRQLCAQVSAWFNASEGRSLLWLTLAAIALWTLGIGNVPLRDWDEGSHAMVARELTRQNNWLYLTFFGEPYFMKPPLGYWLVSLSYRLWGAITEGTTRLPMALLTACGVPLLYGVGRELFERRREALYGAAVYLTLLPVVRHGRLLMLDGAINTFFLLLLWFLLRSRRSRPWAVGMGLCLAAIALLKGVLVLALWGIAGAFILIDRQWRVLRNPYTWLGVALGLSWVLGWYFAQWQRYGDIFVEIHLGTQNFARLSTAVEGNDGPPWYYLLEILKYTWPWLLFWPGGLFLAWKHRQTTPGRLILSGTLLFLGLISAMGTKLPWYVMPLYPFFALAVGWQLGTMAEDMGVYAYRLRWVFGGFTIAGLGGAVYFAIADRQLPLILLGITFAITMGRVAGQLWERDRRFIPTLFIGMYVCLSCLMVSRSWVWELNEAFPVVALGQLIAAETPPGQVIYTSFAYNRPSLDFYSERRVLPAPPDHLPTLRRDHFIVVDAPTQQRLHIPDSAIVGQAAGFSLVQPEK